MYLGRMSLGSEDVFKRGVMVLSLEPELDFDARQRGEGDKQSVDEKTGVLVWTLTGLDMVGLDPEERERGFRGSPDVKIRILSDTEPQLPAQMAPGMGAVVQLDGLTVTPYLNTDKCNGQGHRCRAELKYSIRATGVGPFRG